MTGHGPTAGAGKRANDAAVRDRAADHATPDTAGDGADRAIGPPVASPVIADVVMMMMVARVGEIGREAER